MKAKEFLNKKTLTAIETVDNLILNLVIDQTIYGLKVDTKSITAGTKLNRTKEFTIKDNVLSSGELSIDLSIVDMLESTSVKSNDKNII